MFNIVGKRFWFFLISGVVILIAIVSLVIFGLKFGIEFSPGSMLTVSFENEVNQDELAQELTSLGYTNVLIQNTGRGDFIIRTHKLIGDDKTNQPPAAPGVGVKKILCFWGWPGECWVEKGLPQQEVARFVTLG